MPQPIDPNGALVEHVLTTPADRLPAAAREATLRILIDTLGAMLGANAPALALPHVLDAYLQLEGGEPRASVVGREQRTGGLMAWEADPTEQSRAFNCGTAARNGVTAALLAAGGMGAPTDALSGEHGMLGAFGDARSSPDLLAQGLGARFAACETQIKRFACCAFLQLGVDATVGLKVEHAVTAADVAAIWFEFPRGGAAVIDGNDVRSHCAQYVLAVALSDGDVTFEDLANDRRLTEPGLRDERLRAKFVRLAAPVVGARAADAVLDLAHQLPRAASLVPLMAALRSRT